MLTEQFWQIIEKSLAASAGDGGRQHQFLKDYLTTLPLNDLFDFQLLKEEMGGNIQDEAFEEFCHGEGVTLSSGGPHALSCWIIAQGQETYMRVYENYPVLLTLLQEEGRSKPPFEELAYVASEAYYAQGHDGEFSYELEKYEMEKSRRVSF